MFPKVIEATSLMGLELFSTMTFFAGARYALMFSTFRTVSAPSLSVTNKFRFLLGKFVRPTITTVTPALFAAKFFHLNDVCANAI
ncbi:hypothetical protein D3C78_834660 [compost metagenome]